MKFSAAEKPSNILYVENRGGSLEGCVVDSNQPEVYNYFSSHNVSDYMIKKIIDVYPCVAIIKRLYVFQSLRGEGYGSNLLKDAIRISQLRGAKAILMIVNQGNDNTFSLVGWYDSFGFATIVVAGDSPLMLLQIQ